MSGKEERPGRRCSPGTQSSTQSSTKSIAAGALRRAVHAAACAAAAALLGACSGTLPMLGGEPEQPVASAPSGPAAAKSKRMRAMSAKDILSEWGTHGLGTPSAKRDRAARTARAFDDIAPPDYAPSIAEIMANAACHACEDRPYHRIVLEASSRHGVPAGLIHAVIQKESSYRPRATSNRRARGLMQITPETGRFLGVRDSRHLYDPRTNIHAGTAYLKYLMRSHDTVDEVLAAYNSGPGNVRKYNGVPPFSETVRYVRDVKRFYAVTSTQR